MWRPSVLKYPPLSPTKCLQVQMSPVLNTSGLLKQLVSTNNRYSQPPGLVQQKRPRRFGWQKKVIILFRCALRQRDDLASLPATATRSVSQGNVQMSIVWRVTWWGTSI